MDRAYWWIGAIVSLTAVSWGSIYVTAYMLENILKMLCVHRACIRFAWHWKEFRVWYLERNAEKRKKKAIHREECKGE